MDYKKIMGYGDKKKKDSKPKQNKIVENIKQEFNLNEGPAYEYKKVYKDIEKQEKLLARSVDKLADLLDKKGLKNQSMMLKGNYMQDVQDFVYKWLKQFMRGIQ